MNQRTQYAKDHPDGAKFSHEEVDYSIGKPHAHCSLCEHYHGIDNCDLVVAPIRPHMWCRKFELDDDGDAVETPGQEA